MKSQLLESTPAAFIGEHLTQRSSSSRRFTCSLYQVATISILLGMSAMSVYLLCRVNKMTSQLHSLTLQAEAMSLKTITSFDVDDQDSNLTSTLSTATNAMVTSQQNLQYDDDVSNGTSSVHTLRVRRSGGFRGRAPDASDASNNDTVRSHKVTVMHLEADSASHRMEIERAGQIMNIWSVRQERRRYRPDFAEYRNNGAVKILRKGLYMIYSQVTYYDNSGRWCHAIKRNEDILTKCLASEWGMQVDPKTERYVPTVHNCFTSIVVHLNRNDMVSIISLYERRTVHHSPDMTFWGLTHLA